MLIDTSEFHVYGGGAINLDIAYEDHEWKTLPKHLGEQVHF